MSSDDRITYLSVFVPDELVVRPLAVDGNDGSREYVSRSSPVLGVFDAIGGSNYDLILEGLSYSLGGCLGGGVGTKDDQ